MSGGSHNYICYHIEDDLCGQMEDKELDDLMKDIAELAHDLEWYHSCDKDKEDYMKTVKNFKQKWFKECAKWIGTDIKFCSICGNEAYWDTDYGQQLFDYCPYCGADMRETKKG